MEWYEYLIAFAAALGLLVLFCVGIFGADALGKRKSSHREEPKEKERRTPKSEDRDGRF